MFKNLDLGSARRIVPLLTEAMSIRSVADFGCGRGAWLGIWQRAGVAVLGVASPGADAGDRLVEAGLVRAADLGLPISLGRRFDLVQSLAAAEHVPPPQAGQFIDNLVAHGTCILFSAAVPGQDGGRRINEQPLGYWRSLFRDRGYVAVDYLRPLIADDPAVQPWCRHNTLLYVRADRAAALPFPLRTRRVADTAEIADYRSLGDRLRHAMARRLPRGAAHRLSPVAAAGTGARMPVAGGDLPMTNAN
jgi:SAM-dependent methyltransferase